MKKMLLILFLVPCVCVAMEGQGDQTSSNAVAPESPRTICRNRIVELEKSIEILRNNLKKIENISHPMQLSLYTTCQPLAIQQQKELFETKLLLAKLQRKHDKQQKKETGIEE